MTTTMPDRPPCRKTGRRAAHAAPRKNASRAHENRGHDAALHKQENFQNTQAVQFDVDETVPAVSGEGKDRISSNSNYHHSR